MGTRLREVVLYSALALAGPAQAVADASPGVQPAQQVRVEIKAGLLTLSARNAPIRRVVETIGAQAGFETKLIGDADLGQVSVSLAGVQVSDAIERILADTNSIIVYASGEAAKRRRVISSVLLMGRGAQDRASSPERNERGAQPDALRSESAAEARQRSAAMLRLGRQGAAGPPAGNADDQALATLSRSLLTDRAPIVRSRAAIALGALGDERALPVLESALGDESFSVRSQAIGALGRIGGERASAMLGAILQNPAANRTERLIAAQALWTQDSESARQYLRSGSVDADDQVRRASSRSPASVLAPAAGGQRGPAAPR